MKKIFIYLSIIVATSAAITSCVKQKFDSPPDTTNIDPNLPVNSTIWELKQRWSSEPVEITDDITISGIVTADDRSGNFYKQIVIQDTSSGIVVLIGRASLYNDFPIGRRVYIKCKGLYLGAYGKFIQLGGKPDASNSLSDIPSAKISNYIIKGSYPHTVTPRVVSINDIKTFSAANEKWIGTLIQIDSAEIKQSEVGSPYAEDPNIASGTDRTIEDCDNKTIVLRNSGYASFRNYLLPAGKGKLVALYSRYNNTAQLIIRDTTDLNLTGARCGGVIIAPPVDITIDSLRKLYNGNMKLGNYVIHGVVTSSYKDSNISSGSLYIQDESGRGINIYYGGTISYKLGDSLKIDISGDSLISYKNLLEVKKSAAKTTTVGTGKTVTPKIITIADLNADLNKTFLKDRIYESVVVKIVGCVITGSPATYNGTKTVTDATGNIALYCRNSAPYKTTNYPTGTVSITALASIFNTPQILIRSLADVQ